MPTKERQQLIATLVAEALRQPVTQDPKFSWLRNKHHRDDFGERFAVIDEIFTALGGHSDGASEKRHKPLDPDAYIGGEYNCILEFDEVQHFSSARARTLLMLPANVPIAFSRTQYLALCRVHSPTADLYRYSKHTRDFDFDGGRTAQRAYFDCFRDLLPTLHGLRPTIRIAAFEVASVTSNSQAARDLLKRIIEEKVAYAPWP